MKRTTIICDRCRNEREYDGMLSVEDARADWAWFWPAQVTVVGYHLHGFSESEGRMGHVCHDCLTDAELETVREQRLALDSQPF